MITARTALAALAVGSLLIAACSVQLQSAGSPGPSIDEAMPLKGVADRGVDPSVVAIDIAGTALCTGALLASDVVLTARRCLYAIPADDPCPANGVQGAARRSPADLHVLVGEDLVTAEDRARAFEFVEPPGDALCGSDVAVLLLDTPIDDRVPLAMRPTAAAIGDHLRSVGFDVQQKLVRDHVQVTSTTATELSLDEATCRTAPGTPAIDEATGALVGIYSRGAPACEALGAEDVYSRLDTASFVDDALALGRKATAAHAAKEVKGPVDMGASCAEGEDCAAGVCASYGGAEYCSRTCGPHDKCPAHFRCMQSVQGPSACVES